MGAFVMHAASPPLPSSPPWDLGPKGPKLPRGPRGPRGPGGPRVQRVVQRFILDTVPPWEKLGMKGPDARHIIRDPTVDPAAVGSVCTIDRDPNLSHCLLPCEVVVVVFFPTSLKICVSLKLYLGLLFDYDSHSQ